MLSRDIFDINMDLDYIISMSTVMRTEEVKKGTKMIAGNKQYSTHGQCFLSNLKKEAN